MTDEPLLNSLQGTMATIDPYSVKKEAIDEYLMDTIKELKEHHNEQMNAVLIHPEVYKYLTRKSHKKIKRRLYYDVYYWTKTERVSKYFESARKAKKYVNYIHNSNLIEDGDCVGMEKTWCYREFTPKHKWYYVSFRPNQFVCVEKY